MFYKICFALLLFTGIPFFIGYFFMYTILKVKRQRLAFDKFGSIIFVCFAFNNF